MLRLTLLLFTTLILKTSCFSQVLKTTSLNLNSGGVIHDVAYIAPMNAYVVVGRFSSIGGTARNNVAFINATNFTVMSQAPITSNNGEIRSVEYYGIPTTTVGNVTTPGIHFIFLGGNFTLINGVQKEYMVTLQYSEVLAPISASSNFQVFNWNYKLNDNSTTYNSGRIVGVNDMTLQNDTLMITGSFYTVTTAITTNAFGVAGFKIDRSASSRLNLIYGNTTIPIGEVGMGIGASGNYYYVGVAKTNYTTTDCYRIPRNLSAAPILVDITSGSPLNDKWYSSFKSLDPAKMGMVSNSRSQLLFRSDGSLNINNEEGYKFSGIETITTGEVAGTIGYDFYNGDLISFRENASSVSLMQRYTPTSNNGVTIGYATVGSPINLLPSTGAYDFHSADSSNRVVIANNKLFLSAPELTSVGGQARTGFAVFCLEPTNPLPFVSPDAMVCEGDTVTYTIPDVQSETGYKWSYSGTGIEYSINNGAFTPYTAPVMNTTAGASTIKIRFPVGATSGTLSVEPYNTCNTSSDYLYAKPQTVAITVNPNPVLGITATSNQFTCIVDTIQIVATSTIPTVNYQWFYPNASTPISTNDSITIFGSGSPSVIYPTGTYYITITEPSTGCFAKGSSVISQNTTPPTINQTDLTSSPQFYTCTTTQMVLSATVPGASVYWTTQADPSVHFTNPHTIFSSTPTYYTLFAIDDVNGCQSQQDFQIQLDTATVHGYLPDYPSYSGSILDTINCITTALYLHCEVVPSDPNAALASVYWIQNNQADLPLTVADSAGMFMNTQTYQFVALNTQNGCSVTKDVTIYFDLTTPFVADYIGASQINCSIDTLTLVHLQTGGNVSESWLDGSGNPTGSNSLFVNGVGSYIYRVTNNTNGCTNADTVAVIQTSEMVLNGTPDTLVCPGDLVTVSVTLLNISESVTYLWSNGDTDNSTTAIGAMDTLTVIATSLSGCIGYDTILVAITNPIQVSVSGFVSCGSGSGSLQVTDVTGGAGSYQYSIDGVNYSSSVLFDSLSPGDYTLSVQDALGCIYTFDESLDPSASAPNMSFLVSTYSELSDTLAIVNNTVYQGFDSVEWVFPSNVQVIYLSDSLALIHVLDTGWVDIELIGFEDTCQYSFIKTIYTGTVAPVYPTTYSSVKIQSLTAYPNPTSGAFTLDVIFGIEQHYEIVITNDLGQPMEGMYASGTGTTISVPFTFPSGTSPGTYHIHVLSDYDARQFNLNLN